MDGELSDGILLSDLNSMRTARFSGSCVFAMVSCRRVLVIIDGSAEDEVAEENRTVIRQCSSVTGSRAAGRDVPRCQNL